MRSLSDNLLAVGIDFTKSCDMLGHIMGVICVGDIVTWIREEHAYFNR